MKINDMIMVSVDDHIVEPGDMFDNHLTKEQLKFAPKLVHENGADFWHYDDKRLPNIGLNAVVGRVPEEFGCEPTAFSQMRKGTYDHAARVADMNANGILGSMCFPSFVGFEGGLFAASDDKPKALTLLKAYNDWHIDEWCGSHPGRFIPLAILPIWDPQEMAKEIRRVKEKGCHNISFTDNPAKKGLPSIHNSFWDPFWKALSDCDMGLHLHIGSGNEPPHTSMETPINAWSASFPIVIANSACDWLHLKALRQYPNMRISLSEGGIGWIPYILERVDYAFEQHHAWDRSDFGGKQPSEVFREHFYTCFIDDKFGVKNLDEVGVDSVMYECDYPHSDCLWPNSPERLHKSLAGLSEAVINKITHENAMRVLNYDPFSILGKENCTVGALREQAKDVDLSLKSYGEHPIGDLDRPVTSGDIVKLFMPEGVAMES